MKTKACALKIISSHNFLNIFRECKQRVEGGQGEYEKGGKRLKKRIGKGWGGNWYWMRRLKRFICVQAEIKAVHL